MNDSIDLALIRRREDLARADLDHELRRAFPREPLRARVANRLRAWASRLEQRGEASAPRANLSA
jgi:hypothetical protein